jgi:hypothetical protein
MPAAGVIQMSERGRAGAPTRSLRLVLANLLSALPRHSSEVLGECRRLGSEFANPAV